MLSSSAQSCLPSTKQRTASSSSRQAPCHGTVCASHDLMQLRFKADMSRYLFLRQAHHTCITASAHPICIPLPEVVSVQAMKKIGLKTPPSGTAESMEQAMEIADQIGSYPLIIRPAFTLGGSGGGIAYNVEEFQQIVESGLQASVTSQACCMMPSLKSCI